MVVRLTMGGRSLTEEEVLFRHQLLKLVQREKLKRSLHRSFAPGKLFGSNEAFSVKEGAFNPHVLSNPLYNSVSSPPQESVPGSSHPPNAFGTKQENEGEAANAVPRQRSRSKTGKSSGSLLQLMKQSHGSLKQLFSKEGMGEDDAIEGKDGVPGKDRKTWKSEEGPLVLEDQRDKQSRHQVSPHGKISHISVVCTDDAKPVVIKPVKLSRGTSPQKSGRVSPVLTDLQSGAEPPMDEAEVVKRQVSADVSLQHNSPRKVSSRNLGPSTSPPGIPSLYSDQSLQERFSVFVEISLKDGIVPSKDQRYAAREQEPAEAQDGSLTMNAAAMSSQEVSSSREPIIAASNSLEEEESRHCVFKKKEKKKSGCTTASTPTHGPLKLLFSGRGSETADEPLSQQMVQDHSDTEAGQPEAVDVQSCSQTSGRSNTRGRTGKQLEPKPQPRPLRKLFNSTILCRCDFDGIS